MKRAIAILGPLFYWGLIISAAALLTVPLLLFAMFVFSHFS